MLVFDSEPLDGYFRGEPSAAATAKLLEQVDSGKEVGTLSTVNAAEVFYVLHRISPAMAEEKMRRLQAWRMRFQSTDAVWREAAKIKASTAIPLGDAYALATAVILRGVLVCSRDSHLRRAAGSRVRLHVV